MGRKPACAYFSRMNKPLAFAILFVGVVLLLFGINAGNSVVSDTKEAFTGTPTDKSLLLIVAGVIGIVVGGFSTFLGRRS